MKVRKPVAVLAALVVALVAVFAVAGQHCRRSRGRSQAAFITDTAGLNDKSFNHLGNVGRLKAQKDLSIRN